MPAIPREKSFDSTSELLSEGYKFISNRCKNLQSDIFETRIALQKVICMQGEEAAKVFYDGEKFRRKKAAPKFVQKTLFGQGGVQGLDDGNHRHRKQLFMSLMSDQSIGNLMGIMEVEINTYLDKWEKAESVVLFDEFNEIIFRSVCQWAGVPFTEEEVDKKTRDVVSMIEGPGTFGLRHWRGRMGRRLIEYWIQDKVKAVRENRLPSQKGTVLHEMSWHRNVKGELLDKSIVAVEIINMIRPTVAIGRYWTFAALALHDHPRYRKKIQEEEKMVEYFTQEVRRYYPFFPFVTAKVRKDFEWKGFAFKEGSRVLLDLYGTNHHSDSWKEPNKFWPERFKDWDRSAFNFIPQGGGDHHKNHRCAGEWITIEAMKLGINFLTKHMQYQVPEQDLSMEMNRFPALPKSRLVIRKVKRITPTAATMATNKNVD